MSGIPIRVALEIEELSLGIAFIPEKGFAETIAPNGHDQYGKVEHFAWRNTIYWSLVARNSYYPSRVLIDRDENPVSPKGGRLAAEQIHGP